MKKGRIRTCCSDYRVTTFDMRKNIIDIVSEGEYNKINKIDKENLNH